MKASWLGLWGRRLASRERFGLSSEGTGYLPTAWLKSREHCMFEGRSNSAVLLRLWPGRVDWGIRLTGDGLLLDILESG